LATLLAYHIEYYLRIEAALHESEERAGRQLLELQTLYRTAPVGLALVDRDLRFLRVNDKLAEIDGLPIDAHIGRTLREVVPNVADTIEHLYRRVIETGESVLEVEIHGTTAAQPGIERDWLVDYYPMKEPDGSVQGVAAIVSEITGRKRAEDALRLSEQRFRDYAAAASDWFWETDAEHRFVWMSANVAALTGVPRESQYGKTRFELMAPGTDPALIEAHRRVLEARQPFRDLEYVRCGPDGDIWLSTSGVPVFGGEGRFAGYRGVGREIGAKKRAEETLRLSEQRFRDFATSASDWLWETDAEHRFTWFSPNVKDLVGVPPEWHYGKTRREIMAPGVDPELIEAHWQALEAHVLSAISNICAVAPMAISGRVRVACPSSMKPVASRAIAGSVATSAIANRSKPSLPTWRITTVSRPWPTATHCKSNSSRRSRSPSASRGSAPCCCSIWITSRRSTTLTAIWSAINCCTWWRAGYDRPSVKATPSRASAATSLPSLPSMSQARRGPRILRSD
jgi:PAS domain S-box-containing protein